MASAGWGGFQNGEIPLSAMVQAEPGMYLQADAAATWQRMDAACPYALSINEAYRDLATQQYYWNRYINHLPGWTVAAVPGTSNHGRGMAVDINEYNGSAFDWLRSNAGNFGWSWATGQASGERWHWEYVGSTGSASAPATINSRLDEARRRVLQGQLGVAVDGDFGPISTTALQNRIGTIGDGDFGEQSTRALQAFIGADVDGVWGSQTQSLFEQKIDAGAFGATSSTPAPSEGIGFAALGSARIVNLQTQLKVDADGDFGINSTKALQTNLGVEADGVFGPVSITALQHRIGAAEDGVWGQETQDKFGPAIDRALFVTGATTPPPEPETLPAGYGFGPDVSFYQSGTIDWPTFRANFAFIGIKAAGAEDPQPNPIYGPAGLTDKHLAGARSVGLPVIFYFFNNGALPVKPQADKFIEVLKTRIQPGDWIALDVENDGTAVPQFSEAQVLEFDGYMETAIGIKTLNYLNRSLMNNGQWGPVVDAGHPLWLAVLDGSVSKGLAAAKKTQFWSAPVVVQYDSSTPAPGYAGNIDKNFANLSELARYAFKAFPVPTPTPDPVDVPKLKDLTAEVVTATNALVGYVNTLE
jgi:GH25 family lysozyme M1 (1,4-beta-N-acetylmuramidase)